MKDAKPILWIKAPIKYVEHFDEHAKKIQDKMHDYHLAITHHDIEEIDLQVLNGEELTDEKYNALMEALKK